MISRKEFVNNLKNGGLKKIVSYWCLVKYTTLTKSYYLESFEWRELLTDLVVDVSIMKLHDDADKSKKRKIVESLFSYFDFDDCDCNYCRIYPAFYEKEIYDKDTAEDIKIVAKLFTDEYPKLADLLVDMNPMEMYTYIEKL